MTDFSSKAALDHLSALVARVILESTGRVVAPKPSDKLIEAGYLDSLSMVNLVLAIQNEFKLELEISDLNEENFGSVQAIAGMLAARR